MVDDAVDEAVLGGAARRNPRVNDGRTRMNESGCGSEVDVDAVVAVVDGGRSGGANEVPRGGELRSYTGAVVAAAVGDTSYSVVGAEDGVAADPVALKSETTSLGRLAAKPLDPFKARSLLPAAFACVSRRSWSLLLLIPLASDTDNPDTSGADGGGEEDSRTPVADMVERLGIKRLIEPVVRLRRARRRSENSERHQKAGPLCVCVCSTSLYRSSLAIRLIQKQC